MRRGKETKQSSKPAAQQGLDAVRLAFFLHC